MKKKKNKSYLDGMQLRASSVNMINALSLAVSGASRCADNDDGDDDDCDTAEASSVLRNHVACTASTSTRITHDEKTSSPGDTSFMSEVFVVADVVVQCSVFNLYGGVA